MASTPSTLINNNNEGAISGSALGDHAVAFGQVEEHELPHRTWQTSRNTG